MNQYRVRKARTVWWVQVRVVFLTRPMWWPVRPHATHALAINHAHRLATVLAKDRNDYGLAGG